MTRIKIAVALMVVFLAGRASGQWVQWPVAEGGNGHWYRLTEANSTWYEAEQQAVMAGGHLTTINSEEENDWLVAQFADADSVTLWIGLYQDLDDPDFSEPDHGWKWIGDPALCRWVTGNPTECYTNWNGGEPNNGGDEQDCVYWYTDSVPSSVGMWDDQMCISTTLAIIERAPSVPTVSEWGLLAMVLLVLTAGTIAFAGRKRCHGQRG